MKTFICSKERKNEHYKGAETHIVQKDKAKPFFKLGFQCN